MSPAIPSPHARLGERLLPELRAIPADDHGVAMRRAVATPFDIPELIALAVAVLGTASSAPLGVALALLVVLRRTRRGMREFAERGAP